MGSPYLPPKVCRWFPRAVDICPCKMERVIESTLMLEDDASHREFLAFFVVNHHFETLTLVQCAPRVIVLASDSINNKLIPS